MFKIECLDGRKGDCLILHYGPDFSPMRVLIDSGAPGTWNNVLRDRLLELKKEEGGESALRIELAIVSHIDDDHIKGFLDYYKYRNRGRDKEQDLIEFGWFWHNSFALLTQAARLTDEKLITSSNAGPIGDTINKLKKTDGRMKKILASYDQGNELSNHLILDGLASNQPIGGLVNSKTPCVTVSGGLKLTITGPRGDRINDLANDWPEPTNTATVAEYLDKSVSNLASITALAEFNGRTVFLTGDARGDDLLEGLKDNSLLNADGKFHVDALKLAHHGSDKNVNEEFFRQLTADHYIICANGAHDNPDAETLEMLDNARPDAAFTLWFTTPLSEIRKKLKSAKMPKFDAIIAKLEARVGVSIQQPRSKNASVTLDLS